MLCLHVHCGLIGDNQTYNAVCISWSCYDTLQKVEEAESNFLRTLEEMGGSLRPQDDVVIHLTVSNLSVVKVLLGKHQEAEMVLRRVLNCVEQDLDDWDEA